MSARDSGVTEVSPGRTLRLLFLTLFIRGQSSRGLTKHTAPKSVALKLGGILALYAFFGCFTAFLIGQPILVLSIYQHALTFFAVGMFIATAAGEALFNREEAEILLHRPVTSQMLLRAKAAVLVQVSLYIALAVNLVGFIVGALSGDAAWSYPFIHLFTTIVSTVFGTAFVVLAYQVCLRVFGREKLEGAMTMLQVLVMISFTLGSQLLPRAIMVKGVSLSATFGHWWMKVLPPTWFASLDDAVAGSHSSSSWLLGGIGIVVTAITAGLAFSKLAGAYESGLQVVNEGGPTPKLRAGRRLVTRLAYSPALRFMLRDSVTRSAFVLVGSYLSRDRETKLRIYPGVAPSFVMPIVMLVSNRGTESGHFSMSGMAIGFATAFMCIVPMTALNLLQYSQQWRAATVFTAAPLGGPSPLIHGARYAVLMLLCAPACIALTTYVLVTQSIEAAAMLLPGIIALPVFSMIAGAVFKAVPLSAPTEEAKNATHVPMMMLSMLAAMALAATAFAAKAAGLLVPFLVLELVACLAVGYLLKRRIDSIPWQLID